jgi:hypothetical protein
LLRAAYGVSLSSFRGGPIFPAMFIGTGGGIALSHLPGLPLIAGVAMGIGALCVVMLTLPLNSVLLATLLLASDGRPGRHAAGDRRSRGRCPDRAPAQPRSRRDANMRAAALPRTVPRMREQCWRHPGSTSRSISPGRDQRHPSRDGRKQHLTLTCATAATERQRRPVASRSPPPQYPVSGLGMRICEPRAAGGGHKWQVS